MTLKYDDLIGLPYAHGTSDCFALVRKFYAANYGIEIKDYARPPLWWVKNPDLDLIKNNFKEEGFELVERRAANHLKPGDVVCMAIGSKIGNHLGVYLGARKLLHQPFRCPSVVHLYTGSWDSSTVYTGRHPGVAAFQDSAPPLNVIDLMPKWKQEQLRAFLQANGLPDGTERARGTDPV